MAASPLPSDPYKALGIAKDATLAQIRSAHRKLVLTCHPDKVYDDAVKKEKAEQFHEVQQAYEILSDDSRRVQYDDRVKLAELRESLLKQKSPGAPPRRPDFMSSRTATSGFEMRGNATYEERVPRRSYDDGYISPRYDDSRGHRSDERHEASSRKASGQTTSERLREAVRKSHMMDEEHLNRKRTEQAARAFEKAGRDAKKKATDRDRRKDQQRKHAARVESDSGSDSEGYEIRFSKRAPPEQSRSRYDDTPPRSRRGPRIVSNDLSDSDEHESKTVADLNTAAAYIRQSQSQKARAGEHVEKDGRRRPAFIRSHNSGKPPQMPQAPPPAATDMPRRSSAAGTHTRQKSSKDDTTARSSSGRDRARLRTPEIVEPHEYDLPRRPNLPTHSSAPGNIKIPSPSSSTRERGLPRSQTHVEPRTQQEAPRVHRSATSPLQSMVPPSGHYPSFKSPLRKSENISGESGYSSTSPVEPIPTPKSTTSRRYVVAESDSESDRGHGKPRIVELEPDRQRGAHRSSDRDRSVSPHSQRPPINPRRSTNSRPSGSGSMRTPPVRSATSFNAESLKSPPPLSRQSSARPSPSSGLFGEVNSPGLTADYLERANWSKRLNADDAIYSPHERRGSADDARSHRRRQQPIDNSELDALVEARVQERLAALQAEQRNGRRVAT